MKPTLMVLAAGMGSRYGGLKQLDGLGPNGETIMDYSVFDAIRAGFGKVVFVIRKDFKDQFEEKILSKYRDTIPVEVVFQCVEDLPGGYRTPSERTRPWGTNHAVLAARDVIREPFAVINSDDFYGLKAFVALHDYLAGLSDDSRGRYCMVAFNLENTTTRNGEVSRGVCKVNENGHLDTIVECQHIGYDESGRLTCLDGNDTVMTLEESTPVSMNFWGFTPDYLEYSQREFIRFLERYVTDIKKEFFIPSVVDKLIKNGEATVDVLDTDSRWFGVTYASDRENVENRLKELHREGIYPVRMFVK